MKLKRAAEATKISRIRHHMMYLHPRTLVNCFDVERWTIIYPSRNIALSSPFHGFRYHDLIPLSCQNVFVLNNTKSGSDTSFSKVSSKGSNVLLFHDDRKHFM